MLKHATRLCPLQCLLSTAAATISAAASSPTLATRRYSSHARHDIAPPPPPPGSSGLPGRGALASGDTNLDTIFALSSAPGRSAVAVIRISGPATDAALQRLLRGRPLPPPRVATLSSLVHAGQLLDRGLVLRFPGPASYTGEDCAELHLHGGPAVLRAVLGALGALRLGGTDGAAPLRLRPAEPGEFSRRAYDSGKLDLTQVEGLADLLAAETESQRRQALLHSGGAARRQHESWRQTLLTCLARLEAVIDFGEDEGLGEEVAAGVAPRAGGLRRQLEAHLAAAAGGELVRSGVRVAIVGPPNAGKSSLLNALAGCEAAIVSAVPGTTRDLVQAQLELGGVKVVLTDSAGLRRTACPVEAEGVRRSLAAAAAAHVVLSVRDATTLAGGGGDVQAAAADGSGGGGGSEGRGGDGAGEGWRLAPGAVQLHVASKADLLPGDWTQQPEPQARAAEGAAGAAAEAGAAAPPAAAAPPDGQPLLVSCKTGQGMAALLAALQREVRRVLQRSGGDDGVAGALVTRARHRHHLQAAVEALRRYDACGAQQLELQCEELRAAARALGRVTGAIDPEQVLDSLFSEFCIGK